MADRKEIISELKAVAAGKTIDALLPPIIFIIVNNIIGLDLALIAALGVALLISLNRLLKKQTWLYALGGLLGVIFAAALAYLTNSAISYFIPAIISSALLLVLSLLSLAAGKPLAAWASHLTRGWPLAWFWRSDVKPAYREVTWFWAALIAMRLFIQFYLFNRGDAATLAWANTLLGWPVVIVVLIITYIYGIWRLRKLAGPGVEEFKANKKPPWQGQTRGF